MATNAKIFRINYKSDFILTLNSDAGWMTPFCIKFWTSAPSQAYYVGWDGTTYTHCAYDPSEPTKLQVQFDDHHMPIGDLMFQVAYHFTVADFPNDTEDEVLNQANITVDLDGEQAKVMLDFTGETAPEIQFALPAYANEAQRIANEQQRIANEQTRIQNEEARIAAEATRQQNESQRIRQEEARVSEFATLKLQSQDATSAANTAAALANEKAALAADKAALAGAAATLANEKAQLAADKAVLAASAAQLANDKAALAQQKADYAQTQGDYAKAQGDTALADHRRAESDHATAADDHSRAESDHATAGSDHTQAGQDHTRAESDHSTAASDHTQAGNDHTTAQSDHTTAGNDHTQAGNDHTRAESDHATASADHTQAGNDHTRAESDHTRAEQDHTDVQNAIESADLVFDISKANAVGGVLATYADLSAALGVDGANVPVNRRQGGMTVKFVLTSDNKYVQNRLMLSTFTAAQFANAANWAIAEEGVYVENPEFFYVKTDAKDKILWGIKTDGDVYYGAGCPQQVIDYIEKKIADLSLDEYENIVTFLADYLGSDTTLKVMIDGINAAKVDKEEGKSLIDEEVSESLSVIEDPEGRSEITTDVEGKIISYRDSDGVKHENVGIETDSATVNHLNLTESGMTEFQQALKDAGFQPGGHGDWSDYISSDGDNPLCIPEPRCAMLNIISDFNLSNLNKKGYNAASQAGVNYDIPTQVEFWDMSGNYFKKWTLMSAQGNSSMAFAKKNIALDFFDSEVDGDAFSIKLGDWGAFDSFHLKAYYTGFMKCESIISYQLAIDMENTYSFQSNRNWKKALIEGKVGKSSYDDNYPYDMDTQIDTNARCIPDAFPVIVYQNGEFYGIYAWCIKKHRDNYHMSKSNPNHIHLDGTLNVTSIFKTVTTGLHVVEWTMFEVRNPKNLVYATIQTDSETEATTYKYDADIAQAEIAGNSDGSTSYDTWVAGTYVVGKIVEHGGHLFMNTVADNDAEPIYHAKNNADDAPDFKNKTGCGWLNVTNTVKVKEAIMHLCDYCQDVTTASAANRKDVFDARFNADNLIDYEIVQMVVGDYDGFNKNWQWTTWDGIKWFANEYDKDCTYGNNHMGTFLAPPQMTGFHDNYALSHYRAFAPIRFISDISEYSQKRKNRYAALRDAGIISVENILNKFVSWIYRVGENNYKKEYEKWANCVCNRDLVLNEQWELYEVADYDEYSGIAAYSDETSYSVGDKCKEQYMTFEAKESVTGTKPIVTIGHKDSIFRIENWLTERLALLDNYFAYNI